MPKVKQEKWTSFLQAARSIMKAEELESLSNQLKQYREEIVVRSLACLNEKADVLLDKAADQAGSLQRNHQEIIRVLAYNHLEMREAMLTLRDGQTQMIIRPEESINAERRQGYRRHQENLRSILLLDAADEDGGPRAGIGDFDGVKNSVLDCLRFRQIVDRYENVKDAHEETFQWVFSDPVERGKAWFNFVDWLENYAGCYWIQGKPGSGKSTLLKAIIRDTRTLQHLKRWAGSFSLLTTSFFFWYLGTPLQKSQEGLLRALLYDILLKAPRLIGEVMPELCTEAAKLGPGNQLEPPDLIELTRWFTSLVNALKKDGTYRTCVFIDGLDEYVGDHSDLANFFLDLSKATTSIKFVLSSRPITACVDAFSSLPNLRLQDLTLEDMRIYTKNRLHNKCRFLSDPETQIFIDEVVNRADGVFLWVSLVIKSLLEGIRDGDTLAELQARLGEMPSGLSELYHHMLDRIPSKYKRQAAEMLQLVTANFSGRPGISSSGYFYELSALQLSYACQDPDEVWNNRHIEITDDEALRRVEHVEVRIRSRCLGFLELSGSTTRSRLRSLNEPTVTLIHRTAMEFLSSDEILRVFRDLTLGQAFDPFLALFTSSIPRIRATPPIINVFGVSRCHQLPWDEYLQAALDLAVTAEMAGSPFRKEYMDAFDDSLRSHHIAATTQTMSYLNLDWDSLPAFPQDSWFDCALRVLSKGKSISEQLRFDAMQWPLTLPQAQAIPFIYCLNGTGSRLLDSTSTFGFLHIAVLYSLSSFVSDSIMKGLREGSLNNENVTALLNFRVHTVYYFQFYEVSSIVYKHISNSWTSTITQLLSRGADPNRRAYKNYTIWELFLCSVMNIAKDSLYEDYGYNLDASQASRSILDQLVTIATAFIAHGADPQATFIYEKEVFQPKDVLISISKTLSGSQETDMRELAFPIGNTGVHEVANESKKTNNRKWSRLKTKVALFYHKL
jgi:hypothetical protein